MGVALGIGGWTRGLYGPSGTGRWSGAGDGAIIGLNNNRRSLTCRLLIKCLNRGLTLT
ncbi:hypothetical protein Hanom_Chr02g00101751 [Helianthus anomalus]